MAYIHIQSRKAKKYKTKATSCEYLKYQNKMKLHFNKDDLKAIPCVHGVGTMLN